MPERETLPFLSAMIVTRNEQEYIQRCLGSLLAQDYPRDRYEILIVDGESTDDTVALARRTVADFAAGVGGAPQVRFLTNEKRILAAGWNMGIKAAAGEYVVRIDGHAYVEPDFLRSNITVMQRVGDAVCVGGPLETVSEPGIGDLIKEALSSPFGVGGSKFRCSKTAGYVDTVAYGLYRKSVFDQVGYLDETLVRTQDNDLHRRIRAAGGRFYMDPSIKPYYFSRNTVGKLLRQQFLSGKWSVINFLKRPGQMALRHFVPLFFVLSLLGSAILGLFWRPFFLLAAAELLLHLACGLIFSIKRTRQISHILAMPFLFLAIHIAYGLGSISGIFYKTQG